VERPTNDPAVTLPTSAMCCRCGAVDQPWDRIAGKAYCPSCQEALALGEAHAVIESVGTEACSVCQRSGTVRFETFPLKQAAPVAFNLCADHLRAIVGRTLGPFAFRQLVGSLGALGIRREDIFLLHDAFYDNHGRALQPAI